MDKTGKFVNQTLVYGLSSALGSVLNFILLPFFTHLLSTSEYGVIGVMNIFGLLIGSLMDFGLSAAVFKYYYDVDEYGKNKVLSTGFTLMLMVSGFLLLVGAIFCKEISFVLYGTNDFAVEIFVLILGIFFKNITGLPLILLRIKEMTGLYLMINNLRVFFIVSLKIFFVYKCNLSILGFFLGDAVGSLIAMAILCKFIHENFQINVSTALGLRMAKFGAPLIPANLTFWVIESADRFFLKEYRGIDMVGIYTIACVFPVALSVIANAFSTSWAPFCLKYTDDSNRDKFYTIGIELYTLAMGIPIIILLFFSGEIMNLITEKSYHIAFVVIPILALAAYFKGLVPLTLIGLYINGKTRAIIIIEIISAVMCLPFYYISAKYFGIKGVSYTSMLVYFFMAFLMVLGSWKYTKFEYNKKIILAFITACVVLVGFAEQIQNVGFLFRFGGCILILVISFLRGFDMYKSVSFKID